MSQGPYRDSYLPVSRAADAVQQQADTILSELHGSIDRAWAFNAHLKARAAEKASHVEFVKAREGWPEWHSMRRTAELIRAERGAIYPSAFAETIAWWGGVR